VAPEQIIRHQAAITGRVTEAHTGRAVRGAQVRITAAPEPFTTWLGLRAIQYGPRWESLVERPDQTRTAPDGHFHFLDLPAGSYTLTAALPAASSRYGTAQVQVVVSHDVEGNIDMVAADITLPSTTLRGQVTDQDADPVAMAEVRVQGSGEHTFSDGQGQYRLTGLEVGGRTITISAAGYQPAARPVQLSSAGTVQLLNVVLVPSAP
jgi:hypothetical protein